MLGLLYAVRVKDLIYRNNTAFDLRLLVVSYTISNAEERGQK